MLRDMPEDIRGASVLNHREDGSSEEVPVLPGPDVGQDQEWEREGVLWGA